MGKVLRAHHTALDRDDALKVLPEAFASDPDRLARFRREAQVLASLNHPNIAHVYGLEQADGVQALIMELVEGETLADRIARGPIPVDEVLPIADEIAEALEAAHEKGIIHRDLKPANIRLRPDGSVKVLDFGLAKALEPVSVGSMNATGRQGRIRNTPLDDIGGRTYDISADGQRFLMLKAVSQPNAPPPQIVVVQHFDEELKRLVPRK